MDDEMLDGEYMVVNSGRIVEIGRGIIKPEFEAAKQIDLNGSVVIPGFWESHLHIATGMRSLMELNLRDCVDSKQLRERVHAYCKKISLGDWVIGHGWDEKKLFGDRFPDRSVLDELCNSHPMVLVRMDGHSLCVNTAAIEHLGLQGLESSPEAPQGTDGKPSGMFFENTASDILASIECLFPDNYIEKVILSAQDLFFKNGITSVNDISIQYGRYLELYRKLGAEGKLKLRITASPYGADEDLVEDFEMSKSNQNERLKIGPSKYFIDGSFGSRTALLWEEYADDPGNIGLQLIETEELEALISRNAAKGNPINIHAIGDKAVSLILDAFDKLKSTNKKRPRSRIEHIQIIKDGDIERFDRNSITASFQPVFLYEVEMTMSRLGKERLPRVYRIKSFIDQGINVLFNSDWPYGGEEFPEKPDGTRYIGFEPVLGIHAACCKQMNESEAVTPDQALKCYTVNPAYVNYREQELGKLKKGYLADFTVLSGDITEIAAEEILNTEVLATYISGKKVYEKKNL
ncbi:MAG TPA: amidohydrolase [Candidatus Nitrosocosmicus sp.]|nr:amidohydrolase [Candidatus Nitrosocosmicus sp.]